MKDILTQEELARLSGLTQPTVSKALAGKRVSKRTIRKLAKAIGVSSAMDLEYLRLLDFLREKTTEGSIVTITDNYSDICLHVNPLLSEERGIIKPSEWFTRPVCFRDLWERGGSIDLLDKLKIELPKAKRITDFDYILERPVKNGRGGDLCRYWKTYYYFELLGVPVRVSVADPSSYEIIPTHC